MPGRDGGDGEAGVGAEDDQHLSQAEVLAAEDVAAPDRAALRRQQMALGHVVDVDHVEDGVDVGRHLAVEEADDRSPGGRRGAVPSPTGNVGWVSTTSAPSAARRRASCSATYFERL